MLTSWGRKLEFVPFITDGPRCGWRDGESGLETGVWTIGSARGMMTDCDEVQYSNSSLKAVDIKLRFKIVREMVRDKVMKIWALRECLFTLLFLHAFVFEAQCSFLFAFFCTSLLLFQELDRMEPGNQNKCSKRNVSGGVRVAQKENESVGKKRGQVKWKLEVYQVGCGYIAVVRRWQPGT